MIQILGFAPDSDPTTPGVLTDCSHLIPFESGMRGAPSAVDVGVDALAAACAGIAGTSDLSGNRRLIAGTAAKLYEQSGTTWTDVSRVGDYTLGTDDRWSFAQFANATIVATPTAPLQRSVTGDFADIAGAPSAKIVVSAKDFVIAFNTSSYADEWYCSAQYDDTDWALDVATQCVSGRLTNGTGPIVAAARFGGDVIVYKQSSMMVARYVGAPAVWDFEPVSTDVGCVGQEAVVETPMGHIFVGEDNVYLHDGTTPRPIATGVIRRWLFADMAPTYRYKTICVWDRVNHIVRIMYASIASVTGAIDSSVVYHVGSGKWGKDDMAVEAAVNYVTPSLTYDGSSPLFTTYDSVTTTLSYDSLFWISGIALPAIVNTSHSVRTLSGVTSGAYFLTGIYGDDQGYSFCRGLRVRFTKAPDSCLLKTYIRMVESGEQDVEDGRPENSVSKADGKFDFRQTGRWHSFRVAPTGDFDVTALRIDLVSAGDR
jgi:hypothetical protein